MSLKTIWIESELKDELEHELKRKFKLRTFGDVIAYLYSFYKKYAKKNLGGRK